MRTLLEALLLLVMFIVSTGVMIRVCTWQYGANPDDYKTAVNGPVAVQAVQTTNEPPDSLDAVLRLYADDNSTN